MRPFRNRIDLAAVTQWIHADPAPYWRLPPPPALAIQRHERLEHLDEGYAQCCPPVLLMPVGSAIAASFDAGGLLHVELSEPVGDGGERAPAQEAA